MNSLTKIAFLASLASLVFLFLPKITLAQNQLLFGQNHFYTVVFRGNGEAVVYAKIVLTNTEDKPLTQFSFEIPKITPNELVIYQQKLMPTCVQYDYRNPDRPCLSYREPDYGAYYPGYYQAEYQKVSYTQIGSLYQLNLPTPIESNKSAALILAYAGKGYVQESFGLSSFNFETLKVSSRIHLLKVTVDLDSSDLVLKGQQSRVNYNSKSNLEAMGVSSFFNSQNLDKIAQQVGLYGALTKEAKDLSPQETFSVKGEYAGTWLRLYLKEILIAVLVISALLAGTYFLRRLLKNRFAFSAFTLGLFSAGSIIGLTLLLRFITGRGLFKFYPYYQDPVLSVVIIITAFLFYIFAVFGPAVWIGSAKGWRAFLFVLAAEIFWLLIILMLYIILIQPQPGLLSTSPIPGPPVVYPMGMGNK